MACRVHIPSFISPRTCTVFSFDERDRGETDPREPSPPRPIARSPEGSFQSHKMMDGLPLSVPSRLRWAGGRQRILDWERGLGWARLAGLADQVHALVHYRNRYMGTRIRTRGSRPYLSQVKRGAWDGGMSSGRPTPWSVNQAWKSINQPPANE